MQGKRVWARGRGRNTLSSTSRAADPGDLARGDACVTAEGLGQVVHAAGGHACTVCLHDDRVESPSDAPPTFRKRREERPGADLGDRQAQVSGLCGQHLLPVSVAHRRAGPGVLARAPRRCGRCLGLDEFCWIRSAGVLINSLPSAVRRDSIRRSRSCRGKAIAAPLASTNLSRRRVARWPPLDQGLCGDRCYTTRGGTISGRARRSELGCCDNR